MNSRVLTVGLFLLVSGMCALVFQAAWLREFRLIFGASTPASAAVLAIFMGGLGLGNAVLGRRVDASPNPLRLYSLFELGISAASVASPFLILLVRNIYFSLGGQESLGIAGATIVRLLLSTLVIGLPTFLMGGTLPAAARAATAAADRSRGSIGWLYALNTIGAVIGTLASTFILLERLGNRETLWAAAAINIVNAALAWKLSQHWSPLVVTELTASDPPAPTAPPPTAPPPTAPPHLGEHPPNRKGDSKHRSLGPAKLANPRATGDDSALPPTWLLYSAAGLVGFVFLLMELVWYRMLGPILGGTTFTFGIILAVALAGIGVGGALYPILYRQRIPTLRDFALTCAWEALALAVPLALGDRLAILTAVLRGLEYFGFVGQASGWVIIAAIVVFPAALISGIQFPLLIALLGRGNRDIGRQVGQVTACNTLGAMAGSLAGGFGLLPLLTAPGAWRLAIVVLALLAIAAVFARARHDRARRHVAPIAVSFCALLCLLAPGPTAVWRHSGIGTGRARMPETTQNALRDWLHASRQSILWQADGQESSVAITGNLGVAFLVNGKSDGNAVTDAGTQIMFPMIGALIHPEPKQSLVIGLGTGESAGWLASLPSMERVEVVELEPAIAHVAELCAPLNNNVLHHPKVRVIFNDGREVLQTSRGQYDLIASEPSNPYRAGVANLYTVEFYRSVRGRLAPRGLFMQWLQGYEIDTPTVRTVLCTARETFEHVEIWEANPRDLVLVCSADPFDYDLNRLRQRVQQPEIREALRVGWRTTAVEGVLAHFIANENYATQVASQGLGWINSDNHNVLEYSFARTVGRNLSFSVEELREEARQRKMNRPLRIEKGVDWEAVEDQRIAFHVGLGDAPLPATLFSGPRASRAEALAGVVYGVEPASIIAAWNKQSRPPVDLIETSVIALAYASMGDEKARPLIDQVRGSSPIDADALTGILEFEQQQSAESAQTFATMFTALRGNPTAQPRLLDAALLRAVRLAERDRRQAPRLYKAVSQPFAVLQHDLRRIHSRWMIAQQVNDAAMLEALAEFEPHVPWNLDFLRSRLAVYERSRSPRRGQAARDLEEYVKWMPDPVVLRPDEVTPPIPANGQ